MASDEQQAVAGPVLGLGDGAGLPGEVRGKAGTLLECGAGAVVLTGGPGGGDLLDLVWEAGGRPGRWELERVPGARRGTGSRPAARLAARRGRGGAGRGRGVGRR